MKINSFITLICIAISALLAYGLYSIFSAENKLLIAAGGFVCFLSTLIMALAVNMDSSRSTMNIRALSFSFFVLLLIGHIIFAYFKVSNPIYIICAGILLCIFLIVVYGIRKSGQ